MFTGIPSWTNNLLIPILAVDIPFGFLKDPVQVGISILADGSFKRELLSAFEFDLFDDEQLP